ncbi:type II secretion system protein GspJ [Rhodothalassium salexigens]|uniref:type II secretion system minor pseudopilin GspJ n=1 Tax=Rhodothalassium salexigens TaxID=1086 RepID=UPI001911C7EC|nr:type II secretion system minor pseudopilin GspJ [Rhodothalassium salexigens]MBK5911645.1 type II secretion system protein GspJ [Rhodothalassium salexigens]MBK5920938.1 type II secretion system protein GspJ [Rhodothalassium salexigens]
MRRRGHGAGRGAAAGFTLVEMLVALALFSLVAAAGAGVLGQTLVARDAIADKDRLLRHFQVARALLKDDLGQIAPMAVRGALGGVEAVGFRGGIGPDADAPILAFVRRGVANPNARAARGSLGFVTYTVRDGDLVRTTRARVHAAPDTPALDRVLLSGVEDVALSFRNDRGWVGQWRTVGTDPARLPRAVALEMTVAGLGRVRQVFPTPGAGARL